MLDTLKFWIVWPVATVALLIAAALDGLLSAGDPCDGCDLCDWR